MKTWTTDQHGERWLHNPQLIVANRSTRRKKTMYTNPRPGKAHMAWVRSFRKKGARTRKHKKNLYGAGMLANPGVRHYAKKAKHHVTKYFKKRTYKTNPPARAMNLMGLQMPPLDAVAFTAIGFIVPPIVGNIIIGMLPASWAGSTLTKWLVKVASVFVPSMIVRKFISQRAGNFMLIGGAVSLALDGITAFFPGVIPGLGYQPMLGAYTSRAGALPVSRQVPLMLPRMVAGTPDRLSPTARF